MRRVPKCDEAKRITRGVTEQAAKGAGENEHAQVQLKRVRVPYSAGRLVKNAEDEIEALKEKYASSLGEIEEKSKEVSSLQVVLEERDRLSEALKGAMLK